jgi:hypothetical protein
MHIAIPHKFSRSEAVKRVKKALEDARPQFADKVDIHEERWEGDMLHFDFTAQGQRIGGTLAIEDSTYVFDAKLPLMLRMFEGRIEKEIKAQIDKLL